MFQTPAAKVCIEQYLAPEMALPIPATENANQTVPGGQHLHFSKTDTRTMVG
jgi:hypothetical protein